MCDINTCTIRSALSKSGIHSKVEAVKSEEKTGNAPKELTEIHRKKMDFATGTSYEGTWNILGMNGQGVYTFPDGKKYEGGFHAGDFHGKGKIIYEDGCVMEGKWSHGIIQERKLIFPHNLVYVEDTWKYCEMPDRRFAIEFEDGIKPAGESYIAAEPLPDVPLGWYYTGDGIYDPVTTLVYDDKGDDVIRGPAAREQKWIERNCRYNPMKPLGPQKLLYQEWQELLLHLPDTSGIPEPKIELNKERQETVQEKEYCCNACIKSKSQDLCVKSSMSFVTDHCNSDDSFSSNSIETLENKSRLLLGQSRAGRSKSISFM